MTRHVDVHGILERAGADADAPEGSQAWALAQVDRVMGELVEAGQTLRQIQMHSAPWYEKGIRQDYARRVGVSEGSSRRIIEKAAEDRFDDALAAIGSAK
jgi:hypothetical protein